MSLILEALRRSEAERQRGRAPGLFVEQATLRRPRTPVPAWALPVAGALLAIVVAAWIWRESARDDTATADPARGAIGTADPAPPPAAARPATVPDAAPTVAIDAAPAVAIAPTPAAGREDAPDPASLPPPVPAAADPVATLDIASAPPVDAVPAPVPEAMPLPSAAAPPPPTAAVGAPADPPLPGLAAVPAAERAALPPLKLSMHVYSDDPARRFVIVDGKRLTEGASVATGIVVEAIRRDGAVLAIGERRVLLSRP